MTTIFIILWLLAGAAAVWRFYHGMLEDWYKTFRESMWDYDGGVFISLFVMSPFLIIGGLATVLIVEIIASNTCWWFTTKNKTK